MSGSVADDRRSGREENDDPHGWLPACMANRTLAPLLALALLAAPLALPAGGAAEGTVVKMMVLGETHGTRDVTRGLVNLAVAKGATGCVCPGDFTYGHWETTPQAWRDMMRPLMGTMVVAQGNHDWPWSDWSSLFPGGAHYFTRDVNGAQLVSVNTEYSLAKGSTQRAWLEARLAERDPGALKVVLLHRPWWLPEGARHPASEFAQKNGATASEMSALMERAGVDLVVSAHEKNHQHSLVRGVHYLVAGGGGPEFYGMGYTLPGAVKRLQANVVTTMEVSPTSLLLKSYTRDGAKVDEWTITASAAPGPAPSPAPAGFQPTAGNEWWVQVKVAGMQPSAVEARVDGGAWRPLAFKSWGDWAASIHAPSGSKVQFQARDAAGNAALSGCYAWP
ncbi:MAG TPA: metallophosphoesterase, partial [Candidatus Thermoplasmatota archaeon]|nr:metallophosphoesterase [Candidatus Thermoplasmatota archaeon]